MHYTSAHLRLHCRRASSISERVWKGGFSVQRRSDKYMTLRSERCELEEEREHDWTSAELGRLVRHRHAFGTLCGLFVRKRQTHKCRLLDSFPRLSFPQFTSPPASGSDCSPSSAQNQRKQAIRTRPGAARDTPADTCDGREGREYISRPISIEVRDSVSSLVSGK